MNHNRDIAAKASTFVNALKTQRQAHMPVMRFAQWPAFIAAVRELMTQA